MRLQADVVFLSPPWGGPVYQKQSVFPVSPRLGPLAGSLADMVVACQRAIGALPPESTVGINLGSQDTGKTAGLTAHDTARAIAQFPDAASGVSFHSASTAAQPFNENISPAVPEVIGMVSEESSAGPLGGSSCGSSFVLTAPASTQAGADSAGRDTDPGGRSGVGAQQQQQQGVLQKQLDPQATIEAAAQKFQLGAQEKTAELVRQGQATFTPEGVR